MNKVILIGRLTRDPELKFTSGSGTPVTSFILAVDRMFKSKDGQKEADFINIVVWNKLAEIVANNITKGRLVAVSGRLQSRSYEGNDGQKKFVVEVIAEDVQFLDRKDGNSGSANSSNSDYMPDFSNSNDDFFPSGNINDIPF